MGYAKCTILIVLLAFLFIGCDTVPAAHKSVPTSDTPSWVQTLRDPLQDLPVLSSQSDLDQSSSKQSVRLGEPQELGARMNTGASVVTQPSRPSTGSGGGGRSAAAQIDLNINAQGFFEPNQQNEPLAFDDVRPSTLELAYRGDIPARPDRQIEQFGYRTVRRGVSTSTSSAPPPEDHLIAPGDELIIDLITDEARRYTPTVGSDGNIAFGDLGSISVVGVRYSALRDHLKEEIQRVRRNFEIRVSIGRMALVPIRVAGEVEHGGVVDLDPRGDLLDLLANAGIRKSGTLRNITVEHADGTSDRIDLYEYLLGLSPPPIVRLSRGDSVLIPAIGPTIAIAGSVQRPGIYELRDGTQSSARIAIEIAGGNTGFSVTDAVQIERTSHGSRALIDITGSKFDESLHDGDLILVGAVDGRLHPVVESRGSLITPGRFQFRQGMTIGDLVRMSGGLEVNAYASQAVLSRLQGNRSILDLELAAGAHITSREIIIVDLERALRGDPAHDLPLSPLDLLRVQDFSDAREIPVVEIIGAVRRPGKYELTAGLRVADVLALAGNLTPDAHREQGELIRRRRTDGRTSLDIDRYRIDLLAVLNGIDRGPQLQTGDQLVIRRLRKSEVRVKVTGFVRFPGEYVLPAGSKITELLAAAGGPLDDSNLRASRFTRVSVRSQQLDRWKELAERTRQKFEQVLEERVNSARSKEASSARIQLEQAEQFLVRLRTTQASGRIVIPFTDPEFPESDANLVLESGDELMVPRQALTISVMGNVFNPITIVHQEGLTTEQLIEQAGGVTEQGDESRVYVVRADGRVEGVVQKSNRFRLDQPLLAGDIVLIPKRALGRDYGSVMLDLILTARSAGEAAALWNLATGNISDAGLSIVDTPASPRHDSGQSSDLLREFQD